MAYTYKNEIWNVGETNLDMNCLFVAHWFWNAAHDGHLQSKSTHWDEVTGFGAVVGFVDDTAGGGNEQIPQVMGQ